MVVFPNAKINLGLNVVKKRDDGFHDIETVFYPVNLREVLEIHPTDSKGSSFSSTGIEIPSNQKGNLVLQAYNLLSNDFDLPNFEFRLHKLIPLGAGLGGGSADASCTIKAINKNCELELSLTKMENYAAKLGSDCPFFIRNEVTFATGKGDEFHSIKCDLKGKYILLVNPSIHLSTGLAFSDVRPENKGRNIPEALSYPIHEWKHLLFNDFEPSVFAIHPVLSTLKSTLYSKGALYASMSGSGSTIFGIFENKPNTDGVDQYSCWVLPLD
ncbi:MAG: 4-diphosphocytidyl-2-C-methyl-D-erythritol kinase [Saprospiraceae bacterium]|jgi:4-diphosphocytidyl-2-C-methyl-D-erythritol kinase